MSRFWCWPPQLACPRSLRIRRCTRALTSAKIESNATALPAFAQSLRQINRASELEAFILGEKFFEGAPAAFLIHGLKRV